MLDYWQRIEEIMKWAGYHTVSALARDIGLNRSENLYQIKRGNNGISKELAETIRRRHPQISKAWLLTGEGEMLYQDKSKIDPDIPVFKSDATQLIKEEIRPEPSYHVSFPVLSGSDFGAFTFSTAMEPDIPRGSILFFQQINLQKIMPGEVYLVVSPYFNGIRKLRKDPLSKKIRLVPRNIEEYDEVLLDLDDIEKLYLLRGIVINRSI